ncbi:MAG: radical SAM protein [Campylobacterales bacterium]|nr:radical SAM protein [Campylobacterales bacterium]
MFYDMPLFRPPAEGYNIILQATLGCSYNKCSFCSMYKTKKFQVRDLNVLKEEISFLSIQYPQGNRVFLADGDALALETSYLLEILKILKEAFPKLQRVSSYGSPLNFQKKSLEDLKILKENGLSLIYYGIESGNDKILKKTTKGIDKKSIIESIQKANQSKIKISATVILGLGGKKYWKEHIDETADLINQFHVNYLSTLQLGLEEKEKENFYKKFGEEFLWQDDEGMLKEQIRFIEKLNPPKNIIFRSNHASNALPLAGNIPKDREKLLNQLNQVFTGKREIVDKRLRGF